MVPVPVPPVADGSPLFDSQPPFPSAARPKHSSDSLDNLEQAMVTQPKYLTGDGRGVKDFLSKFDVFLFDCDGVLWSGEHLFEGTVETLELLRSQGKQIIFVTNNSTKSRADYRQKLTSMGILATVDEVFGSAYSAAIFISRILQLPADKKTVFVLGEAGIETELDSESIRHIGGTDATLDRGMTKEDYVSIASGSLLDPSVGVVLCGLDFHVNYLKLSLAYHYLQRGAVFLATNSDTTLPSSSTLFPGAGACAAPLVAMMGGQKPTSLGKPSQAMMDAIDGKFCFDRKRACMVGDRLDTDIKFGIEGGLGGTLCVLTGVTKRKEDWEGDAAEAVPTAWVDKLGDLKG